MWLRGEICDFSTWNIQSIDIKMWQYFWKYWTWGDPHGSPWLYGGNFLSFLLLTSLGNTFCYVTRCFWNMQGWYLYCPFLCLFHSWATFSLFQPKDPIIYVFCENNDMFSGFNATVSGLKINLMSTHLIPKTSPAAPGWSR